MIYILIEYRLYFKKINKCEMEQSLTFIPCQIYLGFFLFSKQIEYYVAYS